VSVLGKADAVSALLDDSDDPSESDVGNADDPRTTSDLTSESALFDEAVLHPTVTARSAVAVAVRSLRRNCMDLLFIGQRRRRNRGKQ